MKCKKKNETTWCPGWALFGFGGDFVAAAHEYQVTKKNMSGLPWNPTLVILDKYIQFTQWLCWDIMPGKNKSSPSPRKSRSLKYLELENWKEQIKFANSQGYSLAVSIVLFLYKLLIR